MEQTIKINVPEGKVAKYNEETQTIEFVDKEPVRSKSWEEFCKNHPTINNEYFIISDSKIAYYENSVRLSNDDKTLLYSKKDAEGILALIQLTRLHDEWVGDWKPVFENSHSPMWYICILYRNDEIKICESYYVHKHLNFPTKEMAQEFRTCFSNLILKAKKFI